MPVCVGTADAVHPTVHTFAKMTLNLFYKITPVVSRPGPNKAVQAVPVQVRSGKAESGSSRGRKHVGTRQSRHRRRQWVWPPWRLYSIHRPTFASRIGTGNTAGIRASLAAAAATEGAAVTGTAATNIGGATKSTTRILVCQLTESGCFPTDPLYVYSLFSFFPHYIVVRFVFPLCNFHFFFCLLLSRLESLCAVICLNNSTTVQSMLCANV
jgi:hypothetical protein